mmetsp:Transcript_12114/g.38577  ORF Transcript_12114/g.38577 Transcript_12114/m.38577 type:complete len:301 (-) Transcript_12114:70-972(-)
MRRRRRRRRLPALAQLSCADQRDALAGWRVVAQRGGGAGGGGVGEEEGGVAVAGRGDRLDVEGGEDAAERVRPVRPLPERCAQRARLVKLCDAVLAASRRGCGLARRKHPGAAVVRPPRARPLVDEHAAPLERVTQRVGAAKVARGLGRLPPQQHRQDLLVTEWRAARRGRAARPARRPRRRRLRYLAQRDRAAMQLAALQLDQRLVSLAPKAELHDGGAAAALELHAVDRGVEAREELLDLSRAHSGDEPTHAEPRLLLLTRPLLLLAGAVGGRPEPRVDGAHVAAGRVDAAAHVRVAR